MNTHRPHRAQATSLKMQRKRNSLNGDALLFRLCERWCAGGPRRKKDIASELGISQPKFAQLFKEALARGFISHVYTPPQRQLAAERLTHSLGPFGISEVHVVAGGSIDVAHATAHWFTHHGRDGDAVVLDGGQTIGAFVRAVPYHAFQQLKIMPIRSDPASYDVSALGATIELANRCPEQVQLFKVPAWRSKPLDRVRSRIVTHARHSRFVFLGAGPWKAGFTALDFVTHVGLSPQKIQKSIPRSIAGMTGYCAIAANGAYIQIPQIDERMPEVLAYSDLKRIAGTRGRFVVLLAAGAEKAGIVSAMIRAKVLPSILLATCHNLMADLSMLKLSAPFITNADSGGDSSTPSVGDKRWGSRTKISNLLSESATCSLLTL